MKTTLYNTQTETLEGKIREGSYQGVYNSALSTEVGWLPEHIIELSVIENPTPEYDSETQRVTSEWQIDTVAKTYTKVWTIVDKTEAEIIEEANQRAAQREQEILGIAQQNIVQQEREVIKQQVTTLTDEQALESANLFEAYKIGFAYETGNRFYYPIDGKLYKVLQPHTSALEWKPTEAVSLYVEVTYPGVIAEWVQPAGTHDAYQIGNMVTYNGKTWESTAADNVWEPGVYGWIEI